MPPKSLWHLLEGQNTKHYCTWTFRDRWHWSFAHQGPTTTGWTSYSHGEKQNTKGTLLRGACRWSASSRRSAQKVKKMFWKTTWKVNSRNQVLVCSLPPWKTGSIVLNLVYDDEFVINDSEGRIGCASGRTFENHLLCRLLHHVFIKWCWRSCLQHATWSHASSNMLTMQQNQGMSSWKVASYKTDT